MLSASVLAVTEETSAAFQSGHAAWVKGRETALTRPDGWTSLIGLHWISGTRQSVGAAEGDDIRLKIGPGHLGAVEQREAGLFFIPAAGADVSLEGRPLQGELRLESEGRVGVTKLQYDAGKGQITLIERGGKPALRVRHADAPERLHFKGLEVFTPDRGWQIKARFIAHPPGKTIAIVNIIGDVSDTPNPGYVEFERDGRTWRLEAQGDPKKSLNFVFKDATSGKQTYGVARFLQTGPVEADGTVVLDFNRAYNPPCAFTEYATCPLPPKENQFTQKDAQGATVRLAVSAGEKIYAGGHRP